jgi:hypothetical protein
LLGVFYCFLSYDCKKDFIIDLDNILKWVGFSRKDLAKRLLEKHFIIELDYQVLKAAPPIGGAALKGENSGGAGKNKEQRMLWSKFVTMQ